MRFPLQIKAFLLCMLVGNVLQAQPIHYSTESEKGHTPCFDTLRVLGIKTIQDMDRMMPTWAAVAGYDTVVTMEGMIEAEGEGHAGPHVGYEDLPLFHYTHDFCFNIAPDKGFEGLLGYQVFGKQTHIIEGFDAEAEKKEKENGHDTVRQRDLHVEWESGLGQGNNGNPCAELNKRGLSCGGASSGHQLGDIIWNWPTTGDWVHVEGLWIWDRGHPPAEAEIHPLRFMAVRRGLAHKIALHNAEALATRIDIYASSDGGAFNNNKPNSPAYVRPVKMNGRNYTFKIHSILPRPSTKAILNYMIVWQPGNTFSGRVTAKINHVDSSCTITVHWQDDAVPDTAILAQSIYLFWADSVENNNKDVTAVKVTLNKIKLKRRKEFLGKSEFRIFAEVGGNWLFLNDLFGKKGDILNHGLGKTTKRNFKINKEFVVYVPKGKDFRIYVSGWEADGMDAYFGHIVNDHTACGDAKKIFDKNGSINLNSAALHGCLDDNLGEAVTWIKADSFDAKQDMELIPFKGTNFDVCPCSKFKNEKGFKLYYTVEKLK